MTTTLRTVEIAEFKIIGMTVRTTNQNGQSQNDIGNLWGKFMGGNFIEQIPNKETDDVYCIYTDYESDFNGPYTTILGCRVNSFDNVQEDFVSKTIPPTKYQVYKSIGKLPDSVVMRWANYLAIRHRQKIRCSL